MIQINIKATETEVTVTNKTDRLTSGNVNQIQCVFDLSEAFKGLVVRAVFNGKFSTVENGMCYAPELEEGRCRIGVYAYEVVDGKTSLRLSPIPCIEYVYQGTYDSNDVKADKPTPSELESHYALIKEMVDSGVLKGDKGDQGPSGPQGEQGLPGKDGKDGTDGVDGKSAYELAVAQGYQGSIDEWLESLKGIQARTILDVSNGIDFDSLKDGAYDIKGSFKLFNNTIPLNTGDILIKDDTALTIICTLGSFYIKDYNEDRDTIANSYVPTKVEVDKAVENAQTKTEENFDKKLTAFEQKYSNILEFKLITTEEEFEKTFSFNPRTKKPNFNCHTIYAVLNAFLGAEFYPSDRFIEIMMLDTNPEFDVLEQMEIIGTLANIDFESFVTQEQLKEALASIKTQIDYGGYGNTLRLKDNTEFHWGKMTELEITLPAEARTFHSVIYFESPSPATKLTAHERIKFVGDDCAEGVFTPAENTGYEIDVKLVNSSTILAKVTAF